MNQYDCHLQPPQVAVVAILHPVLGQSAAPGGAGYNIGNGAFVTRFDFGD
jgi:hypothetical protein